MLLPVIPVSLYSSLRRIEYSSIEVNHTAGPSCSLLCVYTTKSCCFSVLTSYSVLGHQHSTNSILTAVHSSVRVARTRTKDHVPGILQQYWRRYCCGLYSWNHTAAHVYIYTRMIYTCMRFVPGMWYDQYFVVLQHCSMDTPVLVSRSSVLNGIPSLIL